MNGGPEVQYKILANEAHEVAKNNGFWDSPRNISEVIMLIITEVAEAVEAHRNCIFADLTLFSLADLHDYNTEDYFKRSYDVHIKGSMQDEIADIYIRLFDLCGYIEKKCFPFDYNQIGIHSTLMSGNFAENMLTISHMLCELNYHNKRAGAGYIESIVYDILSHLNHICSDLNIDIEKYIELKMRYNKTRGYKHGKNY